jgi:hypothetical protein
MKEGKSGSKIIEDIVDDSLPPLHVLLHYEGLALLVLICHLLKVLHVPLLFSFIVLEKLHRVLVLISRGKHRHQL